MKRVLIADDTKNIRTLLGKCLQLEGYDVSEAVDGEQALALMKSGGFNLAFLDIKMPGLSGTEVLKEARAAGIGTPVIIITAYATVKNAVECTQLGAVAYLHKPFTADKIRNVLAELQITGDLDQAERLINTGRLQEALAVLKRALADNPLDGHVYQLFSSVCEKLGQYDEARKFRQINQILSIK